jgi:hypothetical protein
MADPGVEHCCSVTLIVVGDDLDPDEVTAILGMPPDRSWRLGERKCFTRPDGTTHYFDSVNDQGGWKRFIPEGDRARPLQEQLAVWVDRLRDLTAGIAQLRQRNWEVELDCFAASGEFVFLPYRTLTKLGQWGIDLALTMSSGR